MNELQITENDLFGEPEDSPREIVILRWVSSDSGDRCIFVNAYVDPSNGSDLLIWKDRSGELYASFTPDEYEAIGLEEFRVFEWLSKTAISILEHFEAYWSLPSENWVIDSPVGWTITVR